MNRFCFVGAFRPLFALGLLLPAFSLGWEYPYHQSEFSSGFDYSVGDYGSSMDTSIWYFPLTTKLKADDHALSFTFPFLTISGPGNVVGAGDGAIAVSDGLTRTTESGFGDISSKFSYYLFSGGDFLPMIDLNMKFKFPTGDPDRGLSTGEFDHSYELDLTKCVGATTFFGTLGYKFFGDPDGFELKDVWYGSLGFSYKITDTTQAGAIYDIRQQTSSVSDGISELTGYLCHRIDQRWKLTAYGVTGFSDASPDLGGGLMFSRIFLIDRQ